MRTLLEHPSMQVRCIYLATPDVALFYRSLGFQEVPDAHYMMKLDPRFERNLTTSAIES